MAEYDDGAAPDPFGIDAADLAALAEAVPDVDPSDDPVGGPEVVLEVNLYRGQPEHPEKHNETNAQVNWLAEQWNGRGEDPSIAAAIDDQLDAADIPGQIAQGLVNAGVADLNLTAGVLSAPERTWLDDYAIQKASSSKLIASSSPLIRTPQAATITLGTSTAITGKTRYSFLRVVTATSANGTPTLTGTPGTFVPADVGCSVASSSGASPAAVATITAIAGDGSTATMSQNAQGTTTAWWIGRDGGNFAVLGQTLSPKAVAGLQGTSVVRKSPSDNGAGWLFNAFAVEGVHTGQILHVYGPGVTNAAGQLTVYTDEGFGWESVTADTITTGQTTTVNVAVDFGSSRERKVKLEFTNWFGWQGIYTEPGDTWAVAAARTDAVVVWETDSYGESNLGGPTATKDAWRSFMSVASKLLGHRRPTFVSQSGTGWLINGKTARTSNEKMRERVPDLIARNPDVWIIALGENDEGSSLAALTAEVDAVVSLVVAGLPRARGYLVGPWGKADDSVDALLALRANVAIQLAAAAHGVPFISPIDGKVYNAAGALLYDGGRWLADADFTPDGIHPLAATSTKLGYKVAAAIARIDQQRRYPS